MKSILQLDRENQLDRQRRLLFCWCYARIEWHSAQTWRSRYWDAYSMIKLTVSLFVARLTQKRYYPAADMVWFSQYVRNGFILRCSCGLHTQRIFRTAWHCGNQNAQHRNMKNAKKTKKYIFRQRCSKALRKKCGKNCCDSIAFKRTMLTKILPPQSRQQHRKNSGRFSHCQWNSEHQDPTHKRQAAASALFCIF